MVKQSRKQRGRGQGMSAPVAPPRISLINIIRRNDIEDEEKSDLIMNAINHGADINERDENGISPLISLMIETNEVGETFMFYEDLIKELVGKDINYMNNNLGSALHYAVFYYQNEYIQELLNNGANINLRNTSGQTPLFLASLYGMEHCLPIFFNNRADHTIPDNQGRLAIEVAALDYQGARRIDTKYKIIGEFCNRGVNNPQLCEEYREWRIRLRQGRRMFNDNEIELVVPEVSQGSKKVPNEKLTNVISYQDIKNGEDIIVITEENGAEFFYKIDTISQWFAQKEAEGNPKTNPGSGSIIKKQDQVTRWTAKVSPETGGKRTRKAKKSKRKTRSAR